MMIKYAILLAVVLVLAAVFARAFLPARHLPGGRARHSRIRLHPRHAHGYRDATTDEQQITGWFGRGFGWNLAIVTGAPGPDVLDIDHHGPARERLPRVHQDPPGRTGRRRRRLRADPGRRDARLLHRHQPAQLRPGDVSGGAA